MTSETKEKTMAGNTWMRTQRKIDTIAGLNALPVGAILRGAQHGVWEVQDQETDGTELRYVGAGIRDYFTGQSLLRFYGPLTVVWEPVESEASEGVPGDE